MITGKKNITQEDVALYSGIQRNFQIQIVTKQQRFIRQQIILQFYPRLIFPFKRYKPIL